MKFFKLSALILIFVSLQAWSDTSKNISLNFKKIQTTKVLKIIADFSGKGIVIPDSKLGVTTVYLKDIPWEEALRAISSSKNLSVKVTDKLIILSKEKCRRTTIFSKGKKNNKTPRK